VKLKNIYNFVSYSIIMKFYGGWRKTQEEREKKKKEKENGCQRQTTVNLENALYHHVEGVKIFQALSLKVAFVSWAASYMLLEPHKGCMR